MRHRRSMETARLVAEQLAATSNGVLNRDQTRAAGLSDRAVARLIASGEWTHVARGLYGVRRPRHVRERAQWAMSNESADTVLGLATVAQLRGWQGLDPDDRDVHTILPRRSSVHRQRIGVRRHWWDLGPDDVEVLDGLRVTTSVRTAADLVPRLDRRRGLSVLDSALNRGSLDAAGLVAARVIARGRHHVASDTDVWDLADGRAQSPLESRCRLACIDAGLAPHELQVRLVDLQTGEVWYGDMGWRWKPGRWLIAECDGEAVHSRAIGDGPDPLFADRGRQNGIVIGAAADVLHFTWRDHNRGVVASTVRAALQRAARDAG